MDLTAKEKSILAALQLGFPDSLEPYAEIASKANVSEDEVIALLQKLKDNGVIRRFGASIKHQKSGWQYNTMLVFAVPDLALAEKCGAIFKQHTNISHCYYRPSSASDWPSAIYAMLHARSEEENSSLIEDLKTQVKALGVETPLVLHSIKELKKTSPKFDFSN